MTFRIRLVIQFVSLWLLTAPAYGGNVALVIKAEAASERYFRHTEQVLLQHAEKVEYFGVATMSLRHSHGYQFKKLHQRVDQLLQSFESVIVVGYSIGGKFAGRLARDVPGVAALILVDPVDGGPPFSHPILDRRYPIYMTEDAPKIRVPTLLIEAELGTRLGERGFSCVPTGLGSPRFVNAIDPSSLSYQLMRGAGHLDFVAPPYGRDYYQALKNCGAGTMPSRITRWLSDRAIAYFLAGTLRSKM